MKKVLTIFELLMVVFGFIAAIALPVYLIIVTMILNKILLNWFIIVNLTLSFLEIMLFISLMLLKSNKKKDK